MNGQQNIKKNDFIRLLQMAGAHSPFRNTTDTPKHSESSSKSSLSFFPSDIHRMDRGIRILSPLRSSVCRKYRFHLSPQLSDGLAGHYIGPVFTYPGPWYPTTENGGSDLISRQFNARLLTDKVTLGKI